MKTRKFPKFGCLSNKHIGAVALVVLLWMGTVTASLAQQETTITLLNPNITASINTVDCTGLATAQVDVQGDETNDVVCISDNGIAAPNLSFSGADGNGGNSFNTGTTPLTLVAGANLLVATSDQLHLQSSPVAVFSSGSNPGQPPVISITGVPQTDTGPPTTHWGAVITVTYSCVPAANPNWTDPTWTEKIPNWGGQNVGCFNESGGITATYDAFWYSDVKYIAANGATPGTFSYPDSQMEIVKEPRLIPPGTSCSDAMMQTVTFGPDVANKAMFKNGGNGYVFSILWSFNPGIFNVSDSEGGCSTSINNTQ